MKAHRWWAFQCPSAHSFPFLVLYRCILEKQGICWGLGLHVSMQVVWSGNISPLICPLLHSSQTPSHYTHETSNRPTDRSREGSTESQLRIFLSFYTRSMKLLLSAAQQTYPCSDSFPGVRVSLRKTSCRSHDLVLLSPPSGVRPQGAVLLCRRWAVEFFRWWLLSPHVEAVGGWKAGEQWEPRWMDQKPRFAAEGILTIGRCSFPSSSRGPGQRAVMSQPMIDEHCVSAASFLTSRLGYTSGIHRVLEGLPYL